MADMTSGVGQSDGGSPEDGAGNRGSALVQQMTDASNHVRESGLDRDTGTPAFTRGKITFAANEVLRPHLTRISRATMWFYCFFGIITLCAPIAIPFIVHVKYHVVTWDIFGIVSTIILILWTYAIYAVREIFRAMPDLGSVVREIASNVWNMERPPSNMDMLPSGESNGSEVAPTPHEERDRAFPLILLTILFCGAGLCYFTSLSVIELLKQKAITPFNKYEYGQTMFVFVAQVWALSFLFLAIDLLTAHYESSHNETFVAVSSMTFASVPVFIGLGLINVYMWLSFYALHGSDENRMELIPFDFISGALSFQMIVSNLLFLTIQLNLFLRVIYATARRTRMN